jgi:hypothetical protein
LGQSAKITSHLGLKLGQSAKITSHLEIIRHFAIRIIKLCAPVANNPFRAKQTHQLNEEGFKKELQKSNEGEVFGD